MVSKIKYTKFFGECEFSKTPFSDWMPKEFVEKRNKEILEMLKNKKETYWKKKENLDFNPSNYERRF